VGYDKAFWLDILKYLPQQKPNERGGGLLVCPTCGSQWELQNPRREIAYDKARY
jgi:hypothetical protein